MFPSWNFVVTIFPSSSAPPYSNPSQRLQWQLLLRGDRCPASRSGEALKESWLSIEFTLLFDGGNSTSVLPSWANHALSQLQTDIYGQ
jgi:hypothetical protein